jgi:hypothetical protein
VLKQAGIAILILHQGVFKTRKLTSGKGVLPNDDWVNLPRRKTTEISPCNNGS